METNTESNGIAFVIFGVTGDLTRRKLMPALYELHLSGRLPQPLCIYGFARRDWTDATLGMNLLEGVQEFAGSQPIDNSVANELLDCARYIRSTFDDIQGYNQLAQLLHKNSIQNIIYYLATPPEDYPLIIKKIGECEVFPLVQGQRLKEDRIRYDVPVIAAAAISLSDTGSPKPLPDFADLKRIRLTGMVVKEH